MSAGPPPRTGLDVLAEYHAGGGKIAVEQRPDGRITLHVDVDLVRDLAFQDPDRFREIALQTEVGDR